MNIEDYVIPYQMPRREKVNSAVLDKFYNLALEYYQQTGEPLRVTDSFRTYEEQADLKRRKPYLAAAPGYSRHETGEALDIDQNQIAKYGVDNWKGLLSKHGFTLPALSKGETWHIELPRQRGIIQQAARIVGFPSEAEAATQFNPEDYSNKKPETISTAPEPTGLDYVIQKLRDYLPEQLPAFTAEAQIEREAKDYGLSVPEYKRQLTDTARTEFANILMRYVSARTLGLSDAIEKFINGDIQTPETMPGTFLGAGASLIGFIQSPYAVGKAITGTRFVPTSQGLRGVIQIMTQGAATLGAAGVVRSIIPSLLENNNLTENTLSVIKSAGTMALVGAAFPLTGFVPTKHMQLIVGIAAMDMIRSIGQGKGLFTLDDLYEKIKDGTIDRKELAQRAFDLLMDIFFIAKTPSMKAQLAEIGKLNPVAEAMSKVSAEEAEQSIMELTGQRKPPPQEPKAKKAEPEKPVFESFTEVGWKEVTKRFKEAQAAGEPKPFYEIAHEVANEKQLESTIKEAEKVFAEVPPEPAPAPPAEAPAKAEESIEQAPADLAGKTMYGGGPEAGRGAEKGAPRVYQDKDGWWRVEGTDVKTSSEALARKAAGRVARMNMEVTPPPSAKPEVRPKPEGVEVKAKKPPPKPTPTKMYGGGPETGPVIAKAAEAIAEDTAKIIRETPQQFRDAREIIRETGKEIWEWYKSPVERKERGYKKIIKTYLGKRQIAGFENEKFLKYIQKAVPDLAKRHGITNWIQAGGDEALLAKRAKIAKWAHKPGYEAALKLTEAEKVIAKEIIAKYDDYLHEAQAAGILQDGLENYVNGLWKQGKANKQELQKLRAEVNSGMLDTRFDYAKRKIFKDYFEGEQAGKTPMNKDIAFLLGHYHQSMYDAIAARKAVAELIKGKADDGLPIVSPSGKGEQILDIEGMPKAYLIKPKSIKAETEDGRRYEYINHPALRKWKWATKDAEGKPIFVQGDLYVHPDIYKELKNILTGSAIRKHVLGRAALSISQNLKGVLLSGLPTPFHQVHVGSHAIFHKINPFNCPEIDFNDQVQRFAVESGLMVYNHQALADFSEGLISGGIATKIPGTGRITQAYGEYLFKDLIPRYKMKLFREAFKRNSEIYKDKYTKEEIGEITANQANAAFGELNYKAMGRNPTLQDIYRLTALAPDFLEARLRFVGQAMRPGGREQATALIRAVMFMYGGAIIANMLFSDEHKPHWDKPFQLVIGDKSYSLRSVPGDIYHLVSDPRSFIYHRFNPVTARTLAEAISQRDVWGKRRDMRDQVGDFFRSITPIPAQGLVNEKEQTLFQSIIRSMGITSWKAKDAADRILSDYFVGHREDLGPAERREQEYKRKFDKLAETYLTEKTKKNYQKMMDFVNARPEVDREKLDKRFGILQKIHGIAEHDFFAQLPHVPPDIRAKAFFQKYNDATTTEKKKYLIQKGNELPGIVSDRFNAELQKLIDARRQGAAK